MCLTTSAAALAAGPTPFLVQPAGTDGCTTTDGFSNGVAAQCADGRGLGGAEAIALSADGKFATVYSYDSGAVATLTRDAITGALSQPNDSNFCLAPTSVGGDCSDGRLPGTGSDSAHAVAIAGDHVYVAGYNGSSISLFDRIDATTGELDQRGSPDGCVSQNGADADNTASACDVDAKLSGPQALAITPDGKFLYSGNDSSVGITAYSINQSTGELTPLGSLAGCYTAASLLGCSTARFASHIYDIALSPDGGTLYAVDIDDSAVAAFTVNADGSLAQISGTGGCVVDNGVGDAGDPCTQGHGLDSPQSAEVSPDGALVSIGASGEKGIAILHRAPDGALSQPDGAAGCVNETSGDGCGPSHKTQNVYRTLFTPDSSALFSAGYGLDTNTGTSVATSGIAIFAVGSDGSLTQAAGPHGCVNDTGVDDCLVARGVLGPVGLALSGDAKSLYIASYTDGGVAMFRLVHAPTCSGASATTAFGSSVAIPVSCTDADGDAVTLAGVDGPGHGTVTFSGLTATYTPAAGFSGADSFRVKGNDGANDSAPVTVSVTVGAGPPPPAGKKNPAKLSLGAKPKRDRRLPFKFTFSGRLTPPAGTTCSGKVTVTVKHGKKTVAKKTARLAASCKWKATVTFKNRKKLGKNKSGKLSAKARYGGSAALNAKSSKALTVRFG